MACYGKRGYSDVVVTPDPDNAARYAALAETFAALYPALAPTYHALWE